MVGNGAEGGRIGKSQGEGDWVSRGQGDGGSASRGQGEAGLKPDGEVLEVLILGLQPHVLGEKRFILLLDGTQLKLSLITFLLNDLHLDFKLISLTFGLISFTSDHLELMHQLGDCGGVWGQSPGVEPSRPHRA